MIDLPDQGHQMSAPEQPADVAQADRLRKDLERAAQAAEGFRKQQFGAAERADAAERVAESCRAALRVLEPETKANGTYAESTAYGVEA